MNKAISVLLVLISFSAYSQVEVRIPYDESWRITREENASFFREVKIDTSKMVFDGPFTDSDFNNNILRTGTYAAGKKQGLFTFYYQGLRQIESRGYFENDKRIEIWDFYNSTGDLRQTVNFTPYGFQVLEYIDNTGTKSIQNGTGDWVLYVGDSDGGVILRGRFFEGTRAGRWTYQYRSGTKILTETYKKGELHEGIYYGNGEKEKYYETKLTADIFDPADLKVIERFETDGSFYGPDAMGYILKKNDPFEEIPAASKTGFKEGQEDLYKFISDNLEYPAAAYNNGVQGKVSIEALIDEAGKASNFRVVEGLDQALNAEAVRLLQLYDKWEPPLVGNTPMKSRIVIPIDFKIE
ncbi:MAG: TonB family protein [Cyclobacteriaceae bacterium]